MIHISVKTMDKAEAIAAGLYESIGKEIDDKYMVELKKQIIHPEIIKKVADEIKIVYTPFNGTGNVPVRPFPSSSPSGGLPQPNP